eukprot:733155-Pyramimonas_sp.AAC.1
MKLGPVHPPRLKQSPSRSILLGVRNRRATRCRCSCAAAHSKGTSWERSSARGGRVHGAI